MAATFPDTADQRHAWTREQKVSTVLPGTRNVAQATSNFGEVPGTRLSQSTLARISDVQVDLELGSRLYRSMRRIGLG